MEEVRCVSCNRLIGELTPPYKIKCRKCGKWNQVGTDPVPTQQ